MNKIVCGMEAEQSPKIGYALIRVGRSHPLSDCRGYAYEHRIIASEKLGRSIKSNEHIHHINGDKTDNRPENLEVLTIAEHRLAHRQENSNLKLKSESNDLIECACGCGKSFFRFDESGRPRNYVSGHNATKLTDDAILEFIGDRSVTVKEISAGLGFHPATINKIMSQLIKDQKIIKFKMKQYCRFEYGDVYLCNPLVNCACGCGEQFTQFDSNGRTRKFISGHNSSKNNSRMKVIMADTTIEWCDKTWNPVSGCDPVSAGCGRCYAKDIANRFWGDRKFSDVQFHEDRLLTPLSWKKPCRVFVNSMSDLFHEQITDQQIDLVFAIMALANQHTFQILTKRPERMMKYTRTAKQRIRMATVDLGRKMNRNIEIFETCEWGYPLPNIWLGVSVENQKAANERIPLLRHTLATIKFLSCEPLLEKVSIFKIDEVLHDSTQKYRSKSQKIVAPADFISWVIVGGESGSGARPCEVNWIEDIVNQCQQYQVPVFVKQLGSNSQVPNLIGTSKQKLKSKKGGDINEFPENLRIRESPKN